MKDFNRIIRIIPKGALEIKTGDALERFGKRPLLVPAVILFLDCALTFLTGSFVPLLFILAGVVMLILYLVCGGAPQIAGHKVYHLQEAFRLPFIAGVESLILIGVLPANSGYEALFDHSGINACIYDNTGKPVLHSRDWTEDAADEDHRIRREQVTGGYVSWVEDLTTISRLNREIEEVTEELEDENDLIRQEKEIHAERVRYETKNRLYNRIASAVRPQAIRVNELLSGEESEEDGQFHENLKYAAVLSAYIKRMGNLMLLTDGQAELSTAELKMAFAESIDYIRLMGCECELIGKGERRIASRLALLSYELFETAIEDVRSRLHSCVVILDAEEAFEMTVMLDAKAEAISSAWKHEFLREADARLSVRYEDDTFYICLAGKEAL